MLFPDRFLEQVEPLQHPEAEASAVVEVADPSEAEQLYLPQEEQEPLQAESLQEQQPEEVPQELLLPLQREQEHLQVQKHPEHSLKLR